MSAVRIEKVEGTKGLDRFLRVAFVVHEGDPLWVPPLAMERRPALDARRSPYFAHAEAAFWVAVRDGRDVGRISAQVDRLEAKGLGHFGMIAAIDDAEVVAALLATAEDWLKARGIEEVTGPLNLSINQETGLLVDGFDTPPMLLMGHDRPWLGPLIERCGYGKAKDVFAYIGDSRAPMSPSAQALLDRPVEGIRMRQLDMRRLDEEIRTLVDIVNDAWSQNWGFVAMTEAEIDAFAKELRLILKPELVWFGEIDGVTAGFILCLPNLNEAIADLKGELFPFGWAKLLWRLKVKGTRSARVPLMGVRKAYSRRFAGAVMPFKLIKRLQDECARQGIHAVEMSWLLEDNVPILRMIEALGGRKYKTYRVYGKRL